MTTRFVPLLALYALRVYPESYAALFQREDPLSLDASHLDEDALPVPACA